MKLETGNLYFIAERDVLTNTTSSYYKIGLVKESRQGDESTRLKEHQTGNPRELSVVRALTSPAVNELETRMHQQFATRRVFGEWFDLSPAELKKAIAAATQFVARQNDLVPVAKKAAQNKEKGSNGKLAKPTADDRDNFAAALQAQAGTKLIESITKATKECFDEVKGLDVSPFINYGESNKSQFDEEKFKAEQPALYKKFLKDQAVSARFTWVSDKSVDRTIPKKVVEAVQAQQMLIDAISKKKPSMAALIELHMGILDLLQFKGQFYWDSEDAKARAQARCGSFDGIDGVCKWVRSGATERKFDRGAFKKSHSETFDRYVTYRTVGSLGLVEMRKYPTR